MNTVRLLLTALAASLFLAAIKAANAGESVSPWVAEDTARVRLVAGGPDADGNLKAGLEFRLDPGWKTYWINPGPTGVPARLDFSGSENVARVETRWPVPRRFDDGGSASVGYAGIVVVPLSITAKEARKPVTLKLILDYGLCEKICIPAHAELALELGPDVLPDELTASQLKGFEARVPVAAALGGKAPLAVTGAGKTAAGLSVDVRFPDGAKLTDVFASSPGVSVGVPQKIVGGSYRITLRSGPNPKTVDIVAVADEQAIKVPVALDDLAVRP